MGTVSVSLPSDGQTIDAADYNVPINTIVTEINGNLDSNNIAEGGVVPNSLVDGTGTSWAWQSWTPTYSGITIGTGTVDAKYRQVGKTVHVRISITFSASTSVDSGNATISLPVNSVSYGTASVPIVNAGIFDDATGSNYPVAVVMGGTTSFGFRLLDSSGTYITAASWSATVPFTFTTSDVIYANFSYEAA